MGVKGLYSCLKPHSRAVEYTKELPVRLGLDVYPFLYKFKHDLDSCIQLFQMLVNSGHTCILYMDGNPPKEKMEELANRRQQRESAYQQAEALKAFLNDPEKSGSLDKSAKEILEKQIKAYEVESYSIKKETKERFLQKIKEETTIPIVLCQGESDVDLIEASKKGEIDVVVGNDMDFFVGGVERLWVLGKTNADPLFLEFDRKVLAKHFGLYARAWVDVALLAGYEKTPHLKRTSVQQAITWIRYYGSLETLFAKRPELLQEQTLHDFLDGRRFF